MDNDRTTAARTQLTDRKTMIQLVKYLVVGVMNTLITLFVIFACKTWLQVNPYVSNAIGYVAGLINSFLWNRTWVFRSNGKMTRQAVVFLTGFCVCYAIQFMVVWLLNQSWFGHTQYMLLPGVFVTGYGIATLIGNVCYTLSNFVYNRLVTFK